MTSKLRYVINPHSIALLQLSLKFEGLYQVVPLATGQTLGMTLHPQRGECDGKGGNGGLESG